MVLEEIVQPLVKWYRDNKRILPWRDKDNAYYTWVSEIMLQQTRVEAVKPYFQRFITELPDIQSLAECTEEKPAVCPQKNRTAGFADHALRLSRRL